MTNIKYQSLALSLRVFVYGTLKPGEANYQYYCQGKVKNQIPAYTIGNLYSLPFGYPAMTEGKNQVRGVLLEFDDSEVLNSLDLLEGYQEQRASSLNEYYRAMTVVYRLDRPSQAIQAWAYYMKPERVRQCGGIEVISGNWSAKSYFRPNSSI